MRIVVIGGSGLIGKKLVSKLLELRYEAIAASPSSGVNTVIGEGLTEALVGAQVVVDSHARYFGAVLNDQLVPQGNSLVGSTRFKN